MMNLSKNAKRSIAFLLITIAIYNLIAFLVPFNKTVVFWIAYCFGFFAILIQVYVMSVAFKAGSTIKSKFYGYPIARIGIIYAVIQLVLSFISMALGKYIPVWVVAIIFPVLLGLAALGFIATDATRDEIVRQDKKIVEDVRFMRNLQSKMNIVASKCNNPNTKKAVFELAEEFKYSDPVSKPALDEIERDLYNSVLELERAVIDDDPSVIAMCSTTKDILIERNRLCKLNKATD